MRLLLVGILAFLPLTAQAEHIDDLSANESDSSPVVDPISVKNPDDQDSVINELGLFGRYSSHGPSTADRADQSSFWKLSDWGLTQCMCDEELIEEFLNLAPPLACPRKAPGPIHSYSASLDRLSCEMCSNGQICAPLNSYLPQKFPADPYLIYRLRNEHRLVSSHTRHAAQGPADPEG